MESFYSEKPGYDQTRHDAVLSLSRSMRSLHQHELNDHSGGISPGTEMEGKLRNSQRRRVPVACGRCRKRKIKCSGDAGDGQGCSNCRSAGNNDCQFLRVNSHELNSHKSSWPYPSVAGGVASSPQLGMMGLQVPTKSTLLSMDSPQSRMAGFQRTPDYEMANHAQGFPRPSNMGMMGYDDEQASSYSQPPSYVIPSASSGALMEYGASSYSPKTWDSMVNGRAPNGCIYSEAETNSMNQNPYAYMMSPPGLMPAGDLSQSPGPVMANVSSTEVPGPDRILPTPTCRSQQIPSTTAGFIPADLTGLPLPSDFKSTFWSPRLGASPDQRHSPNSIVPSNDHFTTNPPSNKPINPTAPELLFNCLPISTAEDGSSPLCTTAPLVSNPSAYPVIETLETPSDYPLPPEIRPTRSFSRDHHTGTSQRLLALTNECSPEIYGYGSSEKPKVRGTSTGTNISTSTGASGTVSSTSNDGSGSVSGSGDDGRCSTATLMSGLPYTRVQHRDSPACLPFNLIPNGLPEYHRSVAKYVHRAPVEPLGNQGAY